MQARSIFGTRQHMKATLIALTLLFCLSSNPAQADEFDKRANSATMVPSSDALAALFWSADPGCAKLKSDLHKRQCQAVSSKRKKDVAGKTFFVAGTAPVTIKSSPKKASSVVIVNSSFATPEDNAWVVGKGKVQSSGPMPYTEHVKVTKKFEDKDMATHWNTHVAPRLKTEFLVRIPKNSSTFKSKGKTGYQVEVVGYRVFDPCKGDIVGAKPASGVAPADNAACEGEPEYVKKVAAPKGPVGPQLAGQLSRQQIGGTLEAVRDQARLCNEAYGIDGQASLRMVIAKDGSLKEHKQEGDFVGSPTGICIDNAMKVISFPAFAGKQMRVSYPIVLR